MQDCLQKIEEFRENSEYQNAWEMWQKIDAQAIESRDALEYYILGGDLGRMVGQWSAADSSYQAAIDLAQDIEDDQLLADLLASLASVWRAQSRFQQALSLYDEADAIYDEYGDDTGQSFVRWGKGGVYRFAGELDLALQLFQEGFEIAENAGAREAAAYCCCGLGGVYRARGAYEESEKWYQDANERMKQLQDRFGIAYSYCGRGNAARMQDDFSAAEQYFEQAADLYRVIGDKVSYAYTLWSWATLCKCTNRLAQARQLFQDALLEFEHVRDERGKTYALSGLFELNLLGEKTDAPGFEELHKAIRAQDLQLEEAYLLLIQGLGTDDQGMYKRAVKMLQTSGSDFVGKSLPLNLP
jgi:tetratricopeptide (TPR) repeat protein